jgi:fructokinase
MSRDPPNPSSPIVFGEVLFDHFVDGSRVLGGAPFNVAWHLRGFGLDPLLISAVGRDDPGEEARERMHSWGLRTKGVQLDPFHPTGHVVAKVMDGEPTFEIGIEQAYDYVDPIGAAACVSGTAPSLIYHGTLALRSDRSWGALERVVQTTGAGTYVDLNLRPPWWTLDRLRWCLGTATWLKLSLQELATASGVDPGELASPENQVRHAEALAQSRSTAKVLVTLGADGSLLVADGRVTRVESDRLAPDEIVDTVGAGDGFSAVACIGVIERWTDEEILRRGNAFAADLCRIRGATSEDPELYEKHRMRWRARE